MRKSLVELSLLISKLYRRNNPKYYYWYDEDTNDMFICHICNQIIYSSRSSPFSPYSKSGYEYLINHGLTHYPMLKLFL